MKFVFFLQTLNRRKRIEIVADSTPAAYDKVTTLYKGWNISMFWPEWK